MAYTITLILLAVSFSLSLIFIAYVFPRRSKKGALGFLVMLVGELIYSGGYFFELYLPAIEQKVFWDNVQFTGTDLFIIGAFAFSLGFTDRNDILIKIKYGIAAYIAIDFVLVWTDFLTHWVRLDFWLNSEGLFPILAYDYGPWFWLYSLIVEILLGTTIVILLAEAFRIQKYYRYQIFMILGGLLISQIGSFFILFGVVPIPNMENVDISPILFILANPLFAIGLFGAGLFDIVPLAKSLLLESIRDVVIVLDLQDRIVEANRNTEKFFSESPQELIGLNIETYFENIGISNLNISDKKKYEVITEIEIRDNEFFEVSFSQIIANENKNVGTLIVIRDITAQRRLENHLRRQATLDPLTEIYNRRCFLEMGEKEINRSRRHTHSLSLLMVDIDYFKNVNDQFGHQAGDKVIKEFAGLCSSMIRDHDLVFRYGGEEFAILLPETDLEGAGIVGERLRNATNDFSIQDMDDEISFTVSIGVATFNHADDNVNFEKLISLADQALYKVKNEGRNRVVANKN